MDEKEAEARPVMGTIFLVSWICQVVNRMSDGAVYSRLLALYTI